jgi:hypothetical protein
VNAAKNGGKTPDNQPLGSVSLVEGMMSIRFSLSHDVCGPLNLVREPSEGSTREVLSDAD